MALKLADIRSVSAIRRSFVLSFFTFIVLFGLRANAGIATFDETEMRRLLGRIPDKASYVKLSSLSLGDPAGYHLSHSLKKKAVRLSEMVLKKNIIKSPVTQEKMDIVVGFIEHLKPNLPKFFERHSSLYIHADSILAYSIMAYKSGRIYLLFDEMDVGNKSGGYKRFSRSIEYNSEKPHAHLIIRKKNAQTKLEEAIDELKVHMAFEKSDRILKFLDTDVYTGQTPEGAFENVVAIEEDLYDGDLSDMVDHCPSPDGAVDMFVEMARSVAEMHAGKYIHRDIKPSNFLYREIADRHHHKRMDIVLADFGQAESATSLNYGQYFCGTPGFIDPQACIHYLNRDAGTFVNFDEGRRADIFALGMSFMDILHGHKHNLHSQASTVNNLIFDPAKRRQGPAAVLAAVERFKNIHETTFPDGKPKLKGNEKLLFKIHQIIAKMMHPEPSERMSLDEVIRNLQRSKKKNGFQRVTAPLRRLRP